MICSNELAKIARKEALKNYHGFVMGTEPTIYDIIKPFSEWTIEEADSKILPAIFNVNRSTYIMISDNSFVK